MQCLRLNNSTNYSFSALSTPPFNHSSGITYGVFSNRRVCIVYACTTLPKPKAQARNIEHKQSERRFSYAANSDENLVHRKVPFSHNPSEDGSYGDCKGIIEAMRRENGPCEDSYSIFSVQYSFRVRSPDRLRRPLLMDPR